MRVATSAKENDLPGRIYTDQSHSAKLANGYSAVTDGICMCQTKFHVPRINQLQLCRLHVQFNQPNLLFCLSRSDGVKSPLLRVIQQSTRQGRLQGSRCRRQTCWIFSRRMVCRSRHQEKPRFQAAKNSKLRNEMSSWCRIESFAPQRAAVVHTVITGSLDVEGSKSAPFLTSKAEHGRTSLNLHISTAFVFGSHEVSAHSGL